MPHRAQTRGVLILVAGPSGSGKDTLISAARRSLAGEAAFVFPTRTITRADLGGEKHIVVSHHDFEAMQRDERFFLDWEARGYRYGIPATVAQDLRSGRTVVCNVSRRIVQAARLKWPHTHAIALSVAPEVARNRLLSRARETEAEIQARLSRGGDSGVLGEPVHFLDSSGPLQRSIVAFVGLLKALGASSAETMTAYHLERAPASRLA